LLGLGTRVVGVIEGQTNDEPNERTNAYHTVKMPSTVKPRHSTDDCKKKFCEKKTVRLPHFDVDETSISIVSPQTKPKKQHTTTNQQQEQPRKLTTMSVDTIIKLRSSPDGDRESMEFEITLEEGEISDLIRDATEDRTESEIEIEISRLKPKCLEKVVEFMKYYPQEKMKEIMTPLNGSTFNEVRREGRHGESRCARNDKALTSRVYTHFPNLFVFVLFCSMLSFHYCTQVVTQDWYKNFVSDENVNRDMLFELLTAANFMGIKPLLDLTVLKVTFQLTGKGAEEVRGM